MFPRRTDRTNRSPAAAFLCLFVALAPSMRSLARPPCRIARVFHRTRGEMARQGQDDGAARLTCICNIQRRLRNTIAMRGGARSLRGHPATKRSLGTADEASTKEGAMWWQDLLWGFWNGLTA
jgi:hypothetical protein